MALFDAVTEILVDSGPLDNLYLATLPPRQVGAVDTVMIPTGGALQRVLGSKPRPGVSWRGPGGTNPHDGGVAWDETAIVFVSRGRSWEDAQAPLAVSDAIRDVLAQFAGTAVVVAGVEIIRCDVQSAGYFDQDERERPHTICHATVWHRPA